MNLVDWHPEDLIDKRHAGTLTEEEQAKLDEHLESCGSCRFEAMVAADLDEEEDAFDDDGEMPDLTHLLPQAAPASRRRKMGAGMLVGAAIFITGSAAALYGVTRPSPPAELAQPAMQPASSLDVQIDPVPNDTASPDTPIEAPKEEPAAETSAKPVTSGRPATAATLFSQANAARRAGNKKRALALYRQLQQRYPDSPEAKVSHATVGRMMLDKDPKSALNAYDDYLKKGDGEVTEEALVGRASALQKLGKKDQERAAWQALLAKYPNSIHASRARARLAALAAEK